MRVGSVAVILGLSLAIAGSSLTASDNRGRDRDDEKMYLALGDSVPFGFMPVFTPEAVNASNFVGYPEYLGGALRLTTANGSCPGETSGGFLESTAQDNGCRAYRANFPLHVAYDGAQADFAADFVKANQTTLVTIQLGANDLFVLGARCVGQRLPTCVSPSAVADALFALGRNLTTTIANLRAAGYGGPIVIVNYYPLDLSNALETQVISLLNDALADAAAQGGAIVADVFTAFSQPVSRLPNISAPCGAGLLKGNPFALTQNPAVPPCDVHPSQTGQRLIAETIARALRRADALDRRH